MKFSDIIGQKEMAERLRTLVDTNRLPHAIMLCGNEGCGKMALALALANYILCSGDKNGNDSCGTCPSCTMLRNNQHPDLHFSFPTIRPKGLSADKKVDSDYFMKEWQEMLMRNGAYFNLQEWLEEMKVDKQQCSINVAECDSLTTKLMMKSNQGGKKICIMWLPEKMNVECQNKMLKLIEEPPTDTHFILLSVKPEQLLETIRSRVQTFNVKPISFDDMSEALQSRRGLSPDDATRIARLSKGNWQAATALLEPGNEEALFFDMYVMLMRLAYMRKVSDLKKWADQAHSLGREKQIRMLTSFQRMTREFFMYNFHCPELTYMTREQEDFAKKFSPFINENNIIGMYELYQRVIKEIGQNVNAKLTFFDLTMKMAVLIHRT